MRTRSSSNLPVVSPNPSTSNPKRRNCKRSKQLFILEESPVDTMADQCTMAELLRAPTEWYAEAIVVPSILAEQFELKHSLINMMTSDQFFGLEKDNPHDHIRWFNKITSTIKYKNVSNSAIKLMLFPFSLAGAAHRWLEKEPSCSIFTWEDLVSKFINEFFSPSRTTNLRNEISNFQQRFDESFHEAWDRYKDLLRACPYHGFTELHQLDTFYNALNPANQESLNSAAATPPLASVKAVEEIFVTYGDAHSYYQCLAAGGNTFPELRDNIQGYVVAAVVNYNQGNSVYRPTGMANQIRPPGFAQLNVQNNQNRFSQPQGYNRGKNFNPEQSYQALTQLNQVVPLNELEKVKRMNEANMKAMQTQINNVKNELRNEMKNSIQASMSNQTNEIKNMMASLFQMNTVSTLGSGSLPSHTVASLKGELKSITTLIVIVLDGPSVPTPPPFINPEVDERVEETLTDQDLAEYTIKVPPPPVQKYKTPSQRDFVVHQRDPLHPNIPYPSRMIKQKQQEKDEKLPKKLGDPGKFLILCGFSELNCKALADLGASINLIPLSVWKKLGLPELISTRMTLELANRAICTPAGIARDVFVLVGKFTFPTNFVIVDYESDPRVPLNLGIPFLRTARALIDVHGEEMILRDGNFLPEELLDLDSTKDLHPPHHVNPLSGSTTSSSSPNQLLEEFADELALITFPPEYDDDLQLYIESDLKEIEYLLYQYPIKDKDSILKDSIDQSNLADLNNNFIDFVPEMFTDEHTLDYSSPPLFDEYDDDLFEVEFDTENVYDDPFESKGEKIKEVDALPSINNEDKVFNLGILIQENLFKVITHVDPEKKDKKLAISNASLVIEYVDPPLYELPFFKEVPRSKMLLPFSSENEEKVFKPGIHTSGKVYFSLIPELSHQGYKVKLSDPKQALRGRYSQNQKTHAKVFCPPVFTSSASIWESCIQI
nr:reverse transcriptase domain-containing protein [Tanacetum cinerariifolium]